MSSPQRETALDAKFRALGDSTRRALVAQLGRGPASVSDLAEPIDMTLATVLKHLAILESGGIVQSEKLGRVRTFRIAPDAFADLEHWVAERKRGWMRSFDRLEQVLAEEEPSPRKKEKGRP